MIAYLEGTLLKKRENRVVLLANHIGYEILLPTVVLETIGEKREGDFVFFYIYHHQTERQPRPVLIGFNSEAEKEFFQMLISVEAIGPLKAAQALTIPVETVAAAIEAKDVDSLKQLKGIGTRTAQKIVATLEGKAGHFSQEAAAVTADKGEPHKEIAEQAIAVLVEQLGFKTSEARQMAWDTLAEDKAITTPEILLEAILRKC